VICIEVDPGRADAADQDHADARVPCDVGRGEGGGEGLRDLRGNRLVHPTMKLVHRIGEKIVGVETPALVVRAIAERLAAHAR